MRLAAALMLLVTVTTAVFAQNEGPLAVPDRSTMKDDSATPYDLKGDFLGMTLELFKENHARVSSEGALIPSCVGQGQSGIVECDLWSRLEKRTIWDVMGDFRLDTIANARAETDYMFFDGQLYFIYSLFSQEDFDDVKQAFLDKFGEPHDSKVKVKEYQNGFGARFTGESLEWSYGVSFIRLEERGLRLDTSTVAFMHYALLERAEARRKASKKRNPDL